MFICLFCYDILNCCMDNFVCECIIWKDTYFKVGISRYFSLCLSLYYTQCDTFPIPSYHSYFYFILRVVFLSWPPFIFLGLDVQNFPLFTQYLNHHTIPILYRIHASSIYTHLPSFDYLLPRFVENRIAYNFN